MAFSLPDISDNITRLIPYTPGKPVEEVERELGLTNILKLASNENSLGPSPLAIKAVQKLAATMHIYPDAETHKLKLAVAAHLDVLPENLVFGNGSDDIIHLLGVTLLGPCDEVIQADPSFVRYEAAAILNNAVCHMVPLTPDYRHDLDAMAARINTRTRLIFITNPNNPTSTIVDKEELARFLDRVPPHVVVVMDEAYYEYARFAPQYPETLPYVREGRNVVVLRTFSKAYGLAGHRIGYGVMRSEIAGWLNRTREPFNVNTMAQAAAIAALEDHEHIARTLAMNEQGKRDMIAAFTELGLPYTPSYANFMWVDTQKDAKSVNQALLRKGIIIRVSDSFRAPTHLRVTIGTPEENKRFLDALREALPTL
jgi:histidinol-phosphate aminotransferase